MHGNDRRNSASRPLVHQRAGGGIKGAVPFQKPGEFCRIQVVGAFIDVDEYRQCPGLADRFGGRDKGIGHGDDGIAHTDTGRHQGEADGVGAAGHAHAIAGIASARELVFELFQHRAADEMPAAQAGREKPPPILLPAASGERPGPGRVCFSVPARSFRRGLLQLVDISKAQHFRRVARHHGIPAEHPGSRRCRRRPWHVSPMVRLARMVAPEPIDAPLLHPRGLPTFQSASVCSSPSSVGGAGIRVVDEGHAVPDEHVVFDGARLRR